MKPFLVLIIIVVFFAALTGFVKEIRHQGHVSPDGPAVSCLIDGKMVNGIEKCKP